MRTYTLNQQQLDEVVSRLAQKICSEACIDEYGNTSKGQYNLGRLEARKMKQGDVAGRKNVSNYGIVQAGKEPDEKRREELLDANGLGWDDENGFNIANNPKLRDKLTGVDITDKYGKFREWLKSKIDKVVGESMCEAFNSNKLRDYFSQHGGVKNRLRDDEFTTIKDRRIYQDGLGDVSDDDIVYFHEYDDLKQAEQEAWEKNHPFEKYGSRRTPFDQNAYYTVYRANDGKCLVVGLDRNKVDIKPTWGGHATKKTADRIMNNGWNFKTRSNRYNDDSDTYYYQGRARDFGLKTSDNYKGKMRDQQQIRSRMSDDEWQEHQKNRITDIHDYLNNNY